MLMAVSEEGRTGGTAIVKMSKSLTVVSQVEYFWSIIGLIVASTSKSAIKAITPRNFTAST